jgi:carboxypeptidase family protein
MLKRVDFPQWMLPLVVLIFAATAFSQSTAKVLGTVSDQSGAAVVGAKVTVKNAALAIERTTETSDTGSYEVAALPPGVYSVQVQKTGFETQMAKEVVLQISNNTVQNFGLKVASTSEVVTVEATAPVIETTTMTVGQTISQRTVQELPLNGRHFVDLALLVPGTVTAPQNGFLTAPLRGQGAFAVNTAGMREDSVNWMVNGINLNDMVQNQVTFQPTVNTVAEFKVDNSTYSAEYGRNAGAIVTIASRSGTNAFHGELYDYIRNDFFDARNAFNRVTTSSGAPNPISPFKRNQFGGDIGGPIVKGKTFFFATYEGERHRQGIATSSLVFPDVSTAPCTGAGAIVTRACIAAAANPVANALLGLIPHANATQGASPVPNQFLGSATAPVDIDQGTFDLNHNFNESNRLHGYFVYQHDLRQEATAGTSIPNFGDTREGKRAVFTLGDTHVFTSALVNEANIGVNRIHITFTPNNTTDPNSLGLASVLGPNETFMPTINITNGALFGAERNFPQGRGDTTVAFADNVSYVRGRHSYKFGVEFRDFRNANFNNDPGQLNFTTGTSFMNGTPDSSVRTLGTVANRITQNALDFYGMDSFKFKPNLTLELGLRYAWNMTPNEASGRLVNFVPGGAFGSMLVPVTDPYQQNNKNFQPRVGFAWDVRQNGKTVVRAGYAYQVDEPITGIVTGLINNNSNFATPISVATQKTFAQTQAIYGSPVPTSIQPLFVDPNFKDANVQSWNLNIQQQITNSSSVMVGYFGNKGTHLENDVNINQTTRLGQVGPGSTNPLTNNTFLPFQVLSPSSPFFPNVGLASTITERQSGSNSIYNALWVTATQRTSHGLQFNGSYTYSHSIDEVSRNNQGIIVQDSTNIFASRSNSDFDVRHRFVVNAIYDLPFKGNIFVSGWQAAPIVSWQTGNPFIIVVNNSNQINGVANSVTPNISGPIRVTGKPSSGQWIANPEVFSSPGVGFGNLRRNSVYGPGFTNVDFSVAKNTKIREKMNLQFRVDAFDLFNHPNYGQPGPQSGGSLVAVLTPGVVGPPPTGNQFTTFSTIGSTRFPTGDSGSSRQLQVALKLQF